jgi:glycosyltransferase involved in cell wall biosynthesis
MHGQSFMVRMAVDGLPRRGFQVRHIPLQLSRSHDDIGRWRPAKALAAVRAGLAAARAARAEPFDALYYVPAPGKRGALWRDIVVLGLARRSVPRLVLHWHASGLGAWLGESATKPELAAAQRALGGADLSIVLSEALRADAEVLRAKRIAVVSNGVPDPSPPPRQPPPVGKPWQVLFLGQCSEEKGVFAAAEAVASLNKAGEAGAYRLVAAGAFPGFREADRFASLARRHPGKIRYAGEVSGEEKRRLFLESDCLCLPSRYPHEGQPLVLLEALAYDLPVVATRWRAIPETLLPGTGELVDTGEPGPVAVALRAVRDRPPAPGFARRCYLDRFTEERHLDRLAAELLQLTEPAG